MNENNQRNTNSNKLDQNENQTLLGTHCFMLGTDVWQLSQKEAITKLFPNHPKLEKLIQIAQILDKYQQEITYYQTRIRNLLTEITKKNENGKEK